MLSSIGTFNPASLAALIAANTIAPLVARCSPISGTAYFIPFLRALRDASNPVKYAAEVLAVPPFHESPVHGGYESIRIM